MGSGEADARVHVYKLYSRQAGMLNASRCSANETADAPGYDLAPYLVISTEHTSLSGSWRAVRARVMLNEAPLAYLPTQSAAERSAVSPRQATCGNFQRPNQEERMIGVGE